MQKKIIALAIAAAISAPAFADNANITVYGKAFLDVESVQNDKTALSSATRVQTNASRLGFKGSEDLGDGLKGWFQYEVQMDADGAGAAGTNGLGSGTRNSGVGLDGSFGTVMMGNWDTPFKLAHNKVELFDNTTVFSALNLIGRANGAAGSNFNTRQKNVVQYWSPAIAGVKVNASYAPDEGSNGTATTQGSNKSLVSAAATYDNHDNGIYVSVAYESRADASVATTADTASRIVGRYTLGDLWIGATVEAITINTSASANYTQNNSELVGAYKLGASTVAVSYATAGATNTNATGATQVSARYGYNFSKRTEGFLAYTQLKNDTAGQYGFSSGSAWGTTAGSTQTAIGAGVIHSF